MSQLWQRREHRVSYETTVRLLASDQHQPVVGRTANLSQSGAFVAAPTTYEIGTELVCDLSPPAGEPSDPLTVNGRVVWVYEPHDGGGGGMGIQFFGLEEPEAAVLHGLAGPPCEQVRQLDAWFDGVAQPVRVEAIPAPSGVRLRTSLPFLRLGSTVSFARDVSGLPNHGVLQSVELRVEPTRQVPCLELHVEAVEPSAADDDLQATRVIGPIIPGQRGVKLEEAPPAAQQRAETTVGARATCDLDPSTAVANSMINAPSTSPPPTEDPSARSTVPADDEKRSSPSTMGEDSSRSQLVLALEHETSAMELEEPRTLVSELGGESISGLRDDDASLEDRSRSHDDDAPAEDWRDRAFTASFADFWQRPQAPRRRTWLWIAGLALCGITLVWTIHVGLWADVGQRLQSEQPGRSVDVAGALADDDQRRTDSGEADTQKPATPATNRETAEARRERHRRQALQAAREGTMARDVVPRPRRFGGSAVLVIPIEGTADGATDYLMTDPPGLVVKLPRAQARLPLDDYRINEGGFGVVWVRRGDDGLHLRFHFTRSQLQHTLTLADDRVAVTLSHPTDELARLDR